MGNLLGNLPATETWVAAFHPNDGGNQFLRRAFGTGSPMPSRSIQPPILAAHQGLVETSEARGLENNSSLRASLFRNAPSAQPKDQSIPRCESWSPLAGSIHDLQLMPNGERFGDYRIESTRSAELDQRHEKMS